MAPIDVAALGREGRDLDRAWKEAIRKHNRHTTRNEYFKRREMDEWANELQAINSKHRVLFKELIAKKKAEAKKAAKKASPKSEKKRTRCPNGTRKNKKTGECEKK
jgi:hypothetical protein